MKKFYSDSQFKIYVEQYGSMGRNVVLIPGAYHTGLCYTDKPDGGKGWAYELGNTFKVFVTDLPGTGRSGYVDFSKINGEFIVAAYEHFLNSLEGKIVLITHSLSGPFGIKLVEKLSDKISHLVCIEPGLIGNVQEELIPNFLSEKAVKFQYKGFDFDLELDKWSMPTAQFINKNKTERFLKDENEQEQYLGSLQAVHPRLMFERFNIKNSQIRLENTERLNKTRFLIISGSEDPVHKKDDQIITEFLDKNGIKVDHYFLGDLDINGNGHMMMLEDNSNDIVRLIINWVNKFFL